MYCEMKNKIFIQFKLNGLSNLYQLDELFFRFKGVWCYVSFLFKFEAKRKGPNQIPHSAAALQMYLPMSQALMG